MPYEWIVKNREKCYRHDKVIVWSNFLLANIAVVETRHNGTIVQVLGTTEGPGTKPGVAERMTELQSNVALLMLDNTHTAPFVEGISKEKSTT